MILKNKKFWRYMSLSAMAIFMLLLIARFFPIGKEYISMTVQNIFIVVYFIAEAKYQRLLVSEKNAKIQELELVLKKKE
ncbi:hypothetical protein [Mesonia aquimarina]|uniref:hypothetical protein n=1 Tax=Mesonia aquimarina TaxID=1504967 RepID=UPI000EF6276D|nr:hypothetical protein [Mesonia aquimarina]